MPVGAELSDARRARGLSLKDLSARTKIRIERLDALEAMQWEELPRLVYLRGFLRTVAEELRLEPDSLTARYLDELSEVAPGYAAREAHPPPVPDEQFVVRESIWDGDPDVDDIIAMDVMRPASPIEQPTLVLVDLPAPPRHRTKQFVAAVAVGLVALVAGWVIGANAERMTRPFRSAAAVPQEHRDVATESNDVRLARARERARAAAAELAAKPTTVALTELVPAPSPEPAAPGMTPTVIEAASVEATPRSQPAVNVSGWWALTTRVDWARPGMRDDLNLGFHLQLEQRGNHVSGLGSKWMENGQSLPAGSRSAIVVEGTLVGRRLELTFTERGTAKANGGTLVMAVADSDTLRGRLVSDAAQVRGTSLAIRLAARPWD